MAEMLDPVEARRGNRIHGICLWLAAANFCIWLFSSHGISIAIQSATRMIFKLSAR
jgi:hypothetical protein